MMRHVTALILAILTGCAIAPPKKEATDPAMVLFLSDYGNAGESVSLCKAAMYRVDPHLKIIDISHDAGLTILDGARYLSHNANYYPPSTVFVAVVEPATGSRKTLVVKSKRGQYFVIPDNGLISILSHSDGIEEAREIVKSSAWVNKSKFGATVYGSDILCPVAAHIAHHDDWRKIGPVAKEVEQFPLPFLMKTDDSLVGQAIGVEGAFGNVISNIELTDFLDLGYSLGDFVALKLGDKDHNPRFVKGFSQVPENGVLIYVDPSGKMALAINKGNFGKTFQVKPPVRLEIKRKVDSKKPAKAG